MGADEPLFDWVGPSETEEWVVVWERPCRHRGRPEAPAAATAPLKTARLAHFAAS